MSDNDVPQHSVGALVAHSPAPVTVFTLSWCSYCHAVRRLLDGLKVGVHIVELDSGIYLDSQLHRQLRGELLQLTGSHTLPQVFVGTHHIGGYTETQASLRSGELTTLLAAQSDAETRNLNQRPADD